MRGPLIGGKDLFIFHWIRKISLRKVHRKFGGEEFFLSCVFFRRERKRVCVKRINYYVGRSVVHGTNVCKQKNIEGSCV
jgi:hypothetical protein